MRAALVVHYVGDDSERNLAAIVDWTARAANAGADLVLFSEAALTGLINDDDPEHDLALGQAIPGPVTDQLGALAVQHRIWLGIGLLERSGSCLYDTALLFKPDGEIGLHYRRIQPQWHGRDADPAVYRQGSTLKAIETPWGRVGFLICGDLFDDEIVQRARALRLDWLLFPFARCFADGTYNQTRWDREEASAYLERVWAVGATALMTNYVAHPDLAGGAFGGAMVAVPDGTTVESLPLGEEGILVTEL